MPNAADYANYRTRAGIAEQEAYALGQAFAQCGVGGEAYIKWTLHDRKGEVPDRVYYRVRRDGEWSVSEPEDIPEWRADVLLVDMDKPINHAKTGQQIGHVWRFEVWTCVLDTKSYMPRTPEQLEAARIVRLKRRAADIKSEEFRELPLFRRQLEEEWANGNPPGLPAKLAEGLRAIGAPEWSGRLPDSGLAD